jgi:putative Mg2+ transporter-C (MgtC) family protein
MLVSLGSSTFVVATSSTGMDAAHVVQGITTGIGFIGAGVILKSTVEERVHGLTTAASVWMTAALGTAAGLGRLWIATFAGIIAWAVLSLLMRVEPRPRPEMPFPETPARQPQ